MSKTGRRYRNPYAVEAQQRQAGPHKMRKRLLMEALTRQERDEELLDAQRSARRIPKEKIDE